MPTALITGAGRGLGQALSRELCAREWDVIAVVRRSESLADLPREARGIVADIGDDSCAEAIREALLDIPSLDLLVNNAGIVRHGPHLAQVHTKDVLDSLNIHCLGALRVTQATLPALLRSSRPLIVNVSSRRGSLASELAGGVGDEISYSYRLAKAAQNMLTVCLHQEFSLLGVRVLAVHPGALLTEESPPDAKLTPTDAANRIIDLVESEVDGVFIEPPNTVLPW